MSTAIRIEVLPARLGDCLLVECPRVGGGGWRMLVDGGPPDTWPLLEARLSRLGPRRRQIDVVVVTHIDSDHIGGMIPFLASGFTGQVGDVWFNGRTHLGERGDTGHATRSIGQGESVVAALSGTGAGMAARRLPWNHAFEGGPVETDDAAGFREVSTPGGPRVTVLSPTTTQLTRLRASWSSVLETERRHRDVDAEPDRLEPLDDLEAIAAQAAPRDASVPNGSSIALLVEHRGASVVLGADAFGTVLTAGLKAVAAARGLTALPVDAVKLPHHGSKGNVLRTLVAAAPARHYLVSSNGDTFHHPDDAALARVLVGRPAGATLWFNYRNARTARWADSALTQRFGYAARYPDPAHPESGIVLELPAEPRPGPGPQPGSGGPGKPRLGHGPSV